MMFGLHTSRKKRKEGTDAFQKSKGAERKGNVSWIAKRETRLANAASAPETEKRRKGGRLQSYHDPKEKLCAVSSGKRKGGAAERTRAYGTPGREGGGKKRGETLMPVDVHLLKWKKDRRHPEEDRTPSERKKEEGETNCEKKKKCCR